MVLNLMQAEELLRQIDNGEVSALDEAYSDMQALVKAAKYGREMESEKAALEEKVIELEGRLAAGTGSLGKEAQLEEKIHDLEVERNTALVNCKMLEEKNHDLEVERNTEQANCKTLEEKIHDLEVERNAVLVRCKKYREDIVQLKEEHKKDTENLDKQHQKKLNEKEQRIQRLTTIEKEWQRKYKRNWILGMIALFVITCLVFGLWIHSACLLEYIGTDVLQNAEYLGIVDTWLERSKPYSGIAVGILGIIAWITYED